MMLPYSGKTSSYLHKHHPDKPNDPGTEAGLRKVWFLDAQWSTCPVEVEEQVIDLWHANELGNDDYLIKTSVNGLLEHANGTMINKRVEGEWKDVPLDVSYIIQYIREHGVADDDMVVIHWWW